MRKQVGRVARNTQWPPQFIAWDTLWAWTAVGEIFFPIDKVEALKPFIRRRIYSQPQGFLAMIPQEVVGGREVKSGNRVNFEPPEWEPRVSFVRSDEDLIISPELFRERR